MSNKTPQPTQTKDELRRMLAQAVLNTPGASRLDAVREAPSEPAKASAPKRATKAKRTLASPNRKLPGMTAPAKRSRRSGRKS